MKIGFTGTRLGMTPAQLEAYRNLFIAFSGRYEVEFHHGDCVGADAEAHDIAIGRGVTTIIHPPEKTEYRAWKEQADKVLPPKSHFARNRDIVDACDVLIATPMSGSVEDWEELLARRSPGGTWYTINYAIERTKKPVVIVWPDGGMTIERGEGLQW